MEPKRWFRLSEKH